MTRRRVFAPLLAIISLLAVSVVMASAPAAAAPPRTYPVHSGIVATSFWVGEIFDPDASDGSQMISTYDDDWYARYGGCDGKVNGTGVKACQTERRTAPDFWPTSMTPKENPFYLDMPFDDLNNSTAYSARGTVVPWANDPGYAGHAKDQRFSYMKNRWVKLTKGDRTCYGQIQDAGPGRYNDQAYVFGTSNTPQNKRYGGAGTDVSPALTGCLGFTELDGITQGIGWTWVENTQVPAGPWTKIVTVSQVNGGSSTAEYKASIVPPGGVVVTTSTTATTSTSATPPSCSG
jgi:hypothetical protein